MQTRSALSLLKAIALLAGCATAPTATATQDIAFIGGSWEEHDAGNGDFLRLLPDREHPGGFVGDQSRIRNGKPTKTSRHPAKDSDARYASSRKVYFEGRLSSCD